MKIDIAGWTSVLPLLLVLGCVHFPMEKTARPVFFEEPFLKVQDVSLLKASVVEAAEGQLILKPTPTRLVKIFRVNFKDNTQALKHLMNRQVAVSAIFRDLIEPYYGLVTKKKCVDLAQFNTDLESLNEHSKHFTVTIPVDAYLNPFDCDRGQPSLHAKYSFLLCEKNATVYEVRDYRDLSETFETTPPLLCD